MFESAGVAAARAAGAPAQAAAQSTVAISILFMNVPPASSHQRCATSISRRRTAWILFFASQHCGRRKESRVCISFGMYDAKSSAVKIGKDEDYAEDEDKEGAT